jgi:ABC-type dipeptide/oligopeptide/nickel transport system permease subunit
MEARATDDSSIFERPASDSSIFVRPASRPSSVTRSIIVFAGSDRRGMVGGILLVLYILVALLGPGISPHDLNAPDLGVRMQAPSWAHWLGTDRIGRGRFNPYHRRVSG